MQVSTAIPGTYWQLCSCRHPLRVAVGDEPATAVGVLLAQDPVDHVGDGLEAPVGVPGRALGSPWAVVDLTHLVQVDEGVEGGQVDAGEGAAYREALALEARGRGGQDQRGRLRRAAPAVGALLVSPSEPWPPGRTAQLNTCARPWYGAPRPATQAARRTFVYRRSKRVRRRP